MNKTNQSKKKIYAACVIAHNPKTNSFTYRVMAIRAVSEAEARGTGLLEIERTAPETAGWQSHACVATEVPPEWIKEYQNV